MWPQPSGSEGQIQTAMIIAAALIEGVTFYALIVCGGSNETYFAK